MARNAQVNNLNQLTSERGYGKTKFTGTLNEPATVTVNGQPAVVKSADGGVPYTFEADVDLASGGNTVTVVATDGNGNVRTNQYSVPTTGVVQNYEYDLNGNTRFEKTAAGVVVREFQWDQENRVVKIIAGTKESQFTYDGESKRVRIRELDGGAETSNQTFIWCGIKPCQKRGSTGGTVVRSYLKDGFEDGSTDWYYTRDHLGSVRDLAASNGTTLASITEFSPWGDRVSILSAGASSDFGHTGHYEHAMSGLKLTLYRAYNRRPGRWASRDPIGELGGINVYAYVRSNPVLLIDPLGLISGDMLPGDSLVPPSLRGKGPDWHHRRNDHQQDRCPRLQPDLTSQPSTNPNDWNNWGNGNPFHDYNTDMRGRPGTEQECVQCIYAPNGDRDDNPESEDSYDYYPPDGTPIGTWNHFVQDVLPYFLYGP